MRKKKHTLCKTITLALLVVISLTSVQPVWAEDPHIGPGTGTGSIVAGIGNIASGDLSSAFGYVNWATALEATAFGLGNGAKGAYSSAFGYNNLAGPDPNSDNAKNVEKASAFGYSNTATASQASAFGYSNEAKGVSSSAFGVSNSARGSYSSAFGYFNVAQAQQSFAFGNNNNAYAYRASAMGYTNLAYTDYSVAIGSNTRAGILGDKVATSALAIGANDDDHLTEATGKYSMAIGYNAKANGEASSAIGYMAAALTESSVAVGRGVIAGNVIIDRADTTRATAIGINSQALGNNSTAVGSENTATDMASTALGRLNKAYGGFATAVGTNNEALGEFASAVGYDNKVEGDESSAFGWQNTASNVFDTAIGYKNTASGGESTAVGYQSNAYTANSVALGSWSVAGVENSTDATNALAIGAGDEAHKTIASGNKSIAIGFSTETAGANSIAIGAYHKIYVNDATAVGTHNIIGMPDQAYGSNSIALGNDNMVIANNAVALGTRARAALPYSLALGDQSDTGDTLPNVGDYTYMGEKLTFAGTDAVGVVSVGTLYQERLITNVAAGRISATSTDAINGSQLWYVADSINTRINDVIAGMPVVDAGNNTTVDVTPASSSGGSTPSGNASTSQPPAEIVQKTYTVSAWDTTVEADAGENNIIVTPTIDTTGMTRDYKLALNKDLTVDSVTATDISATNGTIDNITAKDIQTDTLTATDITATNGAINNITAKDIQTDTLAVTDITATNGTIDNITAKDIQTDTLTAKDITAANATVDNITANIVKVGGNVTIDNKGMSIAGGPSVTTDGVDAGGKKITNVADGVAPTDAVNMGQFGSGMNELGQQIDHLGNRINRVGASAAALAALHPLPEDVGEKLSVAAGAGTYRDKYAGAIGMFYRPTERVMFSLGGSKSGSETLANVGVTFALDKKLSTDTSKAAMAGEIKELKAENAEMKSVIAKQGAEIAELKQMVQALAKKG